MMSATTSKIINFILYQLGWFCCVLGAAWNYPVLGTIIALVLLLVHLLLAESPQLEGRLMLCACLVGLVVDSTQQALGLLTFKAVPGWPLWLPVWIIIIWAQFSTLFHYALYWLTGRYLLAGIFGLFGGPLAYWGGVRLGAAQFGESPTVSLMALALIWAVITPFLFWLSARFDRREGRYQNFSVRNSSV